MWHTAAGPLMLPPAHTVANSRKWHAMSKGAPIAALLGVVVEQIINRLPFGGSIVARLAGYAWALASLFAIPALAIEDCPATRCLQRSGQLVRQRWGEGISGNVIVTAWMFLLAIPLIFVVVVGLAVSDGHIAALIAVLALGALALFAIVAIGAVVRQTFVVALYRYAISEDTPGPFDERDLRAPFGRRRRGLSG